jgi:hypothetical protein
MPGGRRGGTDGRSARHGRDGLHVVDQPGELVGRCLAARRGVALGVVGLERRARGGELREGIGRPVLGVQHIAQETVGERAISGRQIRALQEPAEALFGLGQRPVRQVGPSSGDIRERLRGIDRKRTIGEQPRRGPVARAGGEVCETRVRRRVAGGQRLRALEGGLRLADVAGLLRSPAEVEVRGREVGIGSGRCLKRLHRLHHAIEAGEAEAQRV